MKYSSHCFGCVGLRRAEHCILNVQYPEAEYRSLEARLIRHMRDTGEWGEFFPAALAPVPYNLSHAYDFLPLSKEDALRRGYRWWDGEEEESGVVTEVPESIAVVDDSILRDVFRCVESGRRFRLQKAELVLYRRLNIAPPERHWDARHLLRLAARNPRQLHKRSCAVCGKELLSTVSTARSATVLCEHDFQAALV